MGWGMSEDRIFVPWIILVCMLGIEVCVWLATDSPALGMAAFLAALIFVISTARRV